MLLRGLLFAALLVFTIPVFAQTTVPNDFKKAVEYTNGESTYEPWFMDSFVVQMKEIIYEDFDAFIEFAQVLAAIMSILYFALRSYQMMTGEKKWEILPLMRPFGLAMIIIYWIPFVQLISKPADALTEAMSEKQREKMVEVDNLFKLRAKYQLAMSSILWDKAAEIDVAAGQSTAFFADPTVAIGAAVMEELTTLFQPILALKMKLTTHINLLVAQLLEKLAQMILRLSVYVVFMLQLIYMGILIMLGPISVALSILPMFRESFSTWISRFISVNFYGVVAYLVMYVGGIIQQAALESEINRYKEIVDSDGHLVSMETLMFLINSGILTFGMVILAFLITAVCMFTVPSISTWIVSTSGVNSAVSTTGRAGSKVFGAAKAAAGKIF